MQPLTAALGAFHNARQFVETGALTTAIYSIQNPQRIQFRGVLAIQTFEMPPQPRSYEVGQMFVSFAAHALG